jgi:hypothetical protein
MDNLQKGIVGFFILTVILSISSLVMFYIEVPYKSTVKCTPIDTINTSEEFPFNAGMMHDGKLQDCTMTQSKEPSDIFNILINANIVSGVIFLILSGYAFATRKRSPPEST